MESACDSKNLTKSSYESKLPLTVYVLGLDKLIVFFSLFYETQPEY